MVVNKVLETTSFYIEVKDIFLNKGVSLAAKYGAQITERQTTKFDIK
ncbi:hypothetical protein [Clostridium folliculivorans]|uniref:Uncharacterized protein n=1 Tax=Clostridium folliculivorans TaxID=2886038 RepID=A0A9W5Y0E0_9CLOT|nr:hypothetical protein [Clostridium folliculivorans]GKU24277.1 hypothetical protein CFOLD11_11030 [Clostridium folliculivorans]GKU30382.1 hypothetical protein CFB3_24890 [Clostridium folliculivorans]